MPKNERNESQRGLFPTTAFDISSADDFPALPMGEVPRGMRPVRLLRDVHATVRERIITTFCWVFVLVPPQRRRTPFRQPGETNTPSNSKNQPFGEPQPQRMKLYNGGPFWHMKQSCVLELCLTMFCTVDEYGVGVFCRLCFGYFLFSVLGTQHLHFLFVFLQINAHSTRAVYSDPWSH